MVRVFGFTNFVAIKYGDITWLFLEKITGLAGCPHFHQKPRQLPEWSFLVRKMLFKEFGERLNFSFFDGTDFECGHFNCDSF